MVFERLLTAEAHCFCQDGQYMALEVCRSRVFSISFLEREVLALCARGGPQDLSFLLGRGYREAEIEQALDRLRKRKLVLPADAAPPEVPPLAFSGIARLQLSIAQQCNLRCRYCIVEQGSFGGPPRRMSTEVARQAVDLLLRESGEESRCTLGFSGGEPLLNWPVIRDAVIYGRKEANRQGKEIQYFLKTNGTLFDDEILRFIKEQRIDVLLSLDGPRDVHDRLRPTVTESGCHETVLAGLSRLTCECPDLVYIRATVTRFSPPVSELLDYLKGFGARSVNLQHVIAQDEDYALDATAREQLKDQYTQLVRRFLTGSPAHDLFAVQCLSGHMTHLCRGQGARLAERAAGEYLVVSASGGIYPHPDLAERANYEVGHVGRRLDSDRLGSWRTSLDVDSRPVCRDCWARYICGGACLPAAIKLQGISGKPIEAECQLIRHLIELAIWVHVVLRQRHPQLFLGAFPDPGTGLKTTPRRASAAQSNEELTSGFTH